MGGDGNPGSRSKRPLCKMRAVSLGAISGGTERQPQGECSRRCGHKCGSVPEQQPPRRLQAGPTAVSAGAWARSAGLGAGPAWSTQGLTAPGYPGGSFLGPHGPLLLGHWTGTNPSGTGVPLRTDVDGLSWELLLLSLAPGSLGPWLCSWSPV